MLVEATLAYAKLAYAKLIDLVLCKISFVSTVCNVLLSNNAKKKYFPFTICIPVLSNVFW